MAARIEPDAVTGIDELADISARLERRGIDLLRHRSQFSAGAVDDWIALEQSLATQPVFDVKLEDGAIRIVAALVDGVPGGVRIDASPNTIVIAPTPSTPGVRPVRLSIRTPAPIDPSTLRAAFEDGLLVIRALISRAAAAAPPVSVTA